MQNFSFVFLKFVFMVVFKGCWGLLSFEMVGYAVHKWGELAGVGHVVPIAGGERIGYDEAAFGTRHSDVELAGIFLVLLSVVLRLFG